MNTPDNVMSKIFPRIQAYALRLWDNKKLTLKDLAGALISYNKQLKSIDVDHSPLTSRWCELNFVDCFKEVEEAANGNEEEIMERLFLQNSHDRFFR